MCFLCVAHCIRKGILCYCGLAGKTVFCSVSCEMGKQQLPQQPVLLLLQFLVGHLGMALQISMELCCSAVGATYDVRYGGLLSWGGCEETAEIWGVIFSCTHSFCAGQVWNCTPLYAFSSAFLQKGCVDRPLLFFGNIHRLL